MSTKAIPTPKELAEQIRSQFLVAAQQALNAEPKKAAEQVVAAATELLNKKRDEAILAILGLDHRWGELRMDVTNGRTGVIDAMVYEIAKPVLHDWIKTEVESILTKQGEKLRKDLRKAIETRLRERCSSFSRIDTIATEAVDELFAAAREEFLKEFREEA